MTARQLARELLNLKEELQDKEVVIRAENGELIPADVRLILKDPYKLEFTKEGVDKIILTWK